MANLDACIYCKEQAPPRNRKKAKRLRDTRANRQREVSLYRHLGAVMAREGGKNG